MGWFAVWLNVASEARRRWRAWASLILLVGFTAGTAMALAQAARRSQHAYSHFAQRESAADVVMAGRSSFGLVGSVDLAAVARSRYVAASAPAFVALPFSGRTDTGRVLDAVDVLPIVSGDHQLGTTVEGWKMLAGRRARSSSVGEATASFVLAERLGLHVGSRLEFRFYRADRFGTVALELLGGLRARIEGRDRAGQRVPDYADGPRVELTVVGIEASPAEFPPVLTDLAPVLHLTPAFAHRYDGKIVGRPISYLRLRSRGDLPAFQLEVERLASGQPVSFVATRANQSAKVQRSIRAEALALAIVAFLVALAGALAVGQALSRQTLAESDRLSTLRALGMSRRPLRAITFVRVLVIAASGAVLAVIVAMFGTQYLLLPLARKAELSPGTHVDVPVLSVGVACVLSFALLVGLVATHLAVRRERPVLSGSSRSRRRNALTDRGPFAVAPLPTALGVRFASRHASRAAPAWATILASSFTIALLVGVVTFTTNLQRLLDEPHRYGWNWDVKIGAPGLPDYSGFVVPTLRDDPDISGLSIGSVSQVAIGGTRVDVLALDRVKGAALPTVVAGRIPVRPNEIALGGRTMRAVGARIGAVVDARVGARMVRVRVVGQTVLPEFGDAGQLGTGSVMTRSGLDRLLPTVPANTFLVAFRDRRDVDIERGHLAQALEPIPVRFQARPEDLVELSRGGGLIVVLDVLLSLLLMATLVHALFTSVRARRAELSVLRACGMTRGQVRAIVVWQTITLVAWSLAVGVPLGVLLGRRGWLVFAHELGVALDAALPPARSIAIVIAATLGLALLTALGPAEIAARIRPTRAVIND